MVLDCLSNVQVLTSCNDLVCNILNVSLKDLKSPEVARFSEFDFGDKIWSQTAEVDCE